MNIKKCIADAISFNKVSADFESLIIESISPDKGDYSLPCFSFAKELRDNPNKIAEEIKSTVNENNLIAKCEVVGGYLNFFLNKSKLSEQILENFLVEDFKSNDGEGKIILIDYGSPNLAKYLHIGHLKTTIIGESLARLFEQCGYTVKRLNYIGDYGTPFGKIIGGLKLWGSVEDVKLRGNDALQEYYVKFNQKEAEDEAYTQMARDIFKKIEEKDEEIYPIYQFVIDVALKDTIRMFNILGVKFDDYRGEMYYSQFVPQIVEMLESKNLLKTSQGAKIVDLEAFNLTPAVIVKGDGTSLYTTRDICAVIERDKEYHFDKMLYVTDVSQILNFKQLFKIMELAGYDFYKDMEHIPYGRLSLPDGKISSRRGKQAVLVDFMEYISKKANEVILGRSFEIENAQDVAQKVARAVLNFSVLKVERGKDSVFDVEKAFSFDGETAPYMQYTYTRLESILRKYEKTNAVADYLCFDDNAFELIKNINNFKNLIALSLQKRDVSLVLRQLMEMCKTFNKMYNSCKILDGNENTTKAKINLVKALRDTFKIGFHLICIDTLQEM